MTTWTMQFSFVRSVSSFVCSFFYSFELFSKNRWRPCDVFSPKIFKIGAILAIFWSFKDFAFVIFPRWCLRGGVWHINPKIWKQSEAMRPCENVHFAERVRAIFRSFLSCFRIVLDRFRTIFCVFFALSSSSWSQRCFRRHRWSVDPKKSKTVFKNKE